MVKQPPQLPQPLEILKITPSIAPQSQLIPTVKPHPPTATTDTTAVAAIAVMSPILTAMGKQAITKLKDKEPVLMALSPILALSQVLTATKVLTAITAPALAANVHLIAVPLMPMVKRAKSMAMQLALAKAAILATLR